ncbi:MAG: 2Fe-2S iron-sulfur cluster-binding protein [Spirochaetaceae bacterium]|nr:2Fe-2S iron-sulfur cluster-binding protein [Spirochaetaceae bacterium]
MISGRKMQRWRIAAPLFQRTRMIRRTGFAKPAESSIPALRDAVHPVRQHLMVARIVEESPSTKTYYLKPSDPESWIAPFQAGAYLSVYVADVDDTEAAPICRPYSISNTPDEAQAENAYAVTVRSQPGSFIAERIHRTWQPGVSMAASDPQGFFTYEALRDAAHVVFIAGGSGVTPFRSLVGDILTHVPDVSITLIQGASAADEFLFDEDFQKWEKSEPARFRRITVLSGDDEATAETTRRGFITASILTEAQDRGKADQPTDFFVCGPPAMHEFVNQEIAALSRPPRRIRREDYGGSGKPSNKPPCSVVVRYSGRDDEVTIQADPGETVLVALERAGLIVPSGCRTGACGLCRGRLLDGKVEYPAPPSGLRKADELGGYFHPCAALPLSDLVMEIPAEPAEL